MIRLTSRTANQFTVAGDNKDLFQIKSASGKVALKMDTSAGATMILSAGIQFGRTLVADTPYLTLQDDYYLGVTATASAETTINLSSVIAASGRTLIIKDEAGNAATNNIIISTEGEEKIDNVNTIKITANYGVARLMSDGTNWFTY
uniref:Putative tail protein n=1 Tax=viral metagenome TaxID=1070528 RepID=A0A6M3Y3J4_9ZZZZ